jgi:spermidine synthase
MERLLNESIVKLVLWRAPIAILAILFTATGAVGLLLEQALEKLVGTVVGSSTPAAAIVLAVYFVGIAAGGGLYSRYGMRLARPFLVYAALEGFVGAWAIFMLTFFGRIQVASASLLVSVDDGELRLSLARFAIACVWILPPTVAMGASFPAIVGGLSRLRFTGETRKTITLFYSLNLVGALMGTLLGSYWLLPLGGPGAALVCCGLIEAPVCVLALGLHRTVRGDAVHESWAKAPLLRFDGSALAVASLGAISGFAFFGFEVVAVHLVGATVGTSAYAFADMLAAILLGMLLSGVALGLIARARPVLSEGALAVALALAAFTLTFTTAYWDRVAELFLLVQPETFSQAEGYRFLFAGALLLPCAIALGSIYPLLFRLHWFDEERREALAGLLVASNAVGCFLGAVVAAFILIPLFGSQRTLLLLAGLLALAAIGVALIRASSPLFRFGLIACALVSLGAASTQPRWDWRGITAGNNVHFSPSYTTRTADLLYVHEDAKGGVTTIVKEPNRRVLLTNGKFQGDDRGQMPAQVGFALVPLVHTTGRNDALVIGLGTGHSAAVIADAGFSRVDIAELAPGIVGAARDALSDLNGAVLGRPNVRLHLEDGRNFVLRSRKTYDLITIELTSVWFAGATNMYAREFYIAVRDRLSQDGVLQQWVQLHHIGVDEILATILTARDVFEHVELYVVGGQGVLLASKTPLTVYESAVARIAASPAMAPHLDVLQSRKLGSLADIERWRLFDERAVDALHGQRPDHVRNTDMNRHLEYSTPRYQVAPGRKRENIAALIRLLPHEAAASRRAALLP